jgi:hypothetical protein
VGDRPGHGFLALEAGKNRAKTPDNTEKHAKKMPKSGEKTTK